MLNKLLADKSDSFSGNSHTCKLNVKKAKKKAPVLSADDIKKEKDKDKIYIDTKKDKDKDKDNNSSSSSRSGVK